VHLVDVRLHRLRYDDGQDVVCRQLSIEVTGFERSRIGFRLIHSDSHTLVCGGVRHHVCSLQPLEPLELRYKMLLREPDKLVSLAGLNLERQHACVHGKASLLVPRLMKRNGGGREGTAFKLYYIPAVKSSYVL